MRNIKFRAWDTSEKKMHTEISLLFANDLNGVFEGLSECGCIVMQYTGLKDKNGVEIFEGDIVRTELGYAQIIVWQDMYAAFVAEYPNGDRPYRVDCTDEIIGNIHENPELLEESHE